MGKGMLVNFGTILLIARNKQKECMVARIWVGI